MILFYVQHLLGIGHLRRTLAVAEACRREGVPVEVISGGFPIDLSDFPELKVHQLSPVRSKDLSFSAIVDGTGNEVDSDFEANRAAELKALFESARPKILVTELFPFGRRRFRFELIPLLEAAKNKGVKIFCSVRDNVQRRPPARETETIDWLKSYYSGVLVHGDPKFMPFSESFAKANEIDSLIAYTGFVDTALAPVQLGSTETIDVVISAGGGAAGHALYRCAAEACALSRHDQMRWVILAGAEPSPEFLDELRTLGGAKLTAEPNRPDFRALLRACRVSVSQAGYNSVVDLLATGAPALVVPFSGEGGESEQPARAQRLQALGRASVLAQDELSPELLATRVDAFLDGPTEQFALQHCEGAKRSAQLLVAALS